MIKHGCPEDFALRIFQQLEGFGEYGFPESHAASFAKLAYVSAWLKRHEPEAFLAALLNSQPMGFYSPNQLVQDARRHHVNVLPRSEERRVGHECVRTCRTQWSPDHYKQQNTDYLNLYHSETTQTTNT